MWVPDWIDVGKKPSWEKRSSLLSFLGKSRRRFRGYLETLLDLRMGEIASEEMRWLIYRVFKDITILIFVSQMFTSYCTWSKNKGQILKMLPVPFCWEMGKRVIGTPCHLLSRPLRKLVQKSFFFRVSERAKLLSFFLFCLFLLFPLEFELSNQSWKKCPS